MSQKRVEKQLSVPSIALCVMANDDTDGLRRLVENVREHVDKVIIAVLVDDDKIVTAARHLADQIILKEGQQHYTDALAKMIESTKTEYVLLLSNDETLDHPERLREIAEKDYDVIHFPRRNWISDYHSNCFSQHDPQMRMFRHGKAEWKEMSSRFEAVEGSSEYRACQCWIDRHQSIEKVREQLEHYGQMLVGTDESQELIAKHDEFASSIEQEYTRRISCGDKIRIVLSYRGCAGVGDVLMTTPSIRELRRRYPNAEITYQSIRGDVLGLGKRRGEYLYECVHPAVDYVDVTQLDKIEETIEAEAKFDLVYCWNYALVGLESTLTDGYELAAAWAGLEPPDGNYKPDWTFAKGEEKFGRNWVKQHCKTERCVGFVISASSMNRMWPFMEDWVNAMLKEYPDVSIMTFGQFMPHVEDCWAMCKMMAITPNSVKPADDYKNPTWYDPDRVISCSNIHPNLVNNLPAWRQAMGLNLREQAAVYPYLDLLVTPDTGPMHIAAALEVPTVAYFSVVQPEIRIKHFPWITSLMADYPCAPCHKQGVVACEKTTGKDGASCLQSITVDMMMKEVGRRLAEKGKSEG